MYATVYMMIYEKIYDIQLHTSVDIWVKMYVAVHMMIYEEYYDIELHASLDIWTNMYANVYILIYTLMMYSCIHLLISN